MKDISLAIMVAVLIGFAAFVEMQHGKDHTQADDYLAAGALLLAVALAVPMQVKNAIDAVRGILPWAKKDGDK